MGYELRLYAQIRPFNNIDDDDDGDRTESTYV